MYVPPRPSRARKPPVKLGFPVAVAKKHKRSQQNRPSTPTRTLECIEVSSSPTPEARNNHDVPNVAVLSAKAYKPAPPEVVAFKMTPEVLRMLPEPSTSKVFGFWLPDDVEYIYTEYRSYCLTNDEKGFPRKTKFGMLQVSVPDNGQAIPFEIMSAKHPGFQKQQLLQGVQFIFYSPESLCRFTNILFSALFLQHLLPVVSWAHIKLVIFDPTCLPQAPELMAWEKIGVGQNPPASWTLAYKHYEDWMKAVRWFCKLPLVALVTLHFRYPYRSFDNLESLSRPLRITDNLGLLAIDFTGEN